MESFACVIVPRLSTPWPPTIPQMLLSNPVLTGEMSITVLPDGSLQVLVREGMTIIAEYRTQPLIVTHPCLAVVKIAVADGQVEVTLNGTLLVSFEEAGGSSFTVWPQQEPVNVRAAYNEPEAVQACHQWMQWRAAHFGMLKDPQENRVAKPLAKQVNELRDAVSALDDQYKLVAEGKLHHVRSVAALLRALIYWPDKKSRSYNPLLLRVAARFSLPLPIFVGDDSLFFGQVDQSIASYKGTTLILVDSGSIFQRGGFNKLVDLQEWLSGDTVYLPLQRRVDGILRIEGVKVSRRDLVASMANTQGSHFDEDDPDTLALMDTFQTADVSITMSILFHVASLVIDLGTYVLTQTGSQPAAEP